MSCLSDHLRCCDNSCSCPGGHSKACVVYLCCSGNGLLLKGGKEASRSNAILHKTIVDAIGSNLGPDLIHLITSRDEISDLLKLDDVIDLVIPRGGNALVSHIQQNTKIPVLGHADGICHVYVDKAADLDKAVKIVVDAKVDYPAACNAVEKVLVHEGLVGNGGLSKIQSALQDAGVQVRGLSVLIFVQGHAAVSQGSCSQVEAAKSRQPRGLTASWLRAHAVVCQCLVSTICAVALRLFRRACWQAAVLMVASSLQPGFCQPHLLDQHTDVYAYASKVVDLHLSGTCRRQAQAVAARQHPASSTLTAA